MYRDPLTPKILDFQFTQEEITAIEYALTLKDSWTLEQKEMDSVRHILKPLRVKIKEYHLARQNGLCCYCRTNLNNGGPFIVDREHIVPKSHCKALTYVMTNLSVACKRCNMEIKKDKTSLLVDPNIIEKTHLSEHHYKIIHPNFEVYENFIKRTQAQEGTAVLVKFIPIKDCSKTDFMFYFFKLKELEIDTFDSAQGLPQMSQEANLLLDGLKSEIQGNPALTGEIIKLLIANASYVNRDISSKEVSDGSTTITEIDLLLKERGLLLTHQTLNSSFGSGKKNSHPTSLLRLPAPNPRDSDSE
jgi:hypothetical protein